jgi:single-strand DNA-binding protein
MYHTVIVAGCLGKDPESRYTPDGKPITSFSVAVNHFYNKSDGEKVKETIWFRVTAMGKIAEVCGQYLKKKSRVIVEGHLSADKETGGPKVWTAKDGTPRASYEIVAQTVRFLDPKPAEGERAPDDVSPF